MSELLLSLKTGFLLEGGGGGGPFDVLKLVLWAGADLMLLEPGGRMGAELGPLGAPPWVRPPRLGRRGIPPANKPPSPPIGGAAGAVSSCDPLPHDGIAPLSAPELGRLATVLNFPAPPGIMGFSPPPPPIGLGFLSLTIGALLSFVTAFFNFAP